MGVVHLTRCAKVEIRCGAPLHLLAVYEQGMRDDGGTIVQGLLTSKLLLKIGRLTRKIRLAGFPGLKKPEPPEMAF